MFNCGRTVDEIIVLLEHETGLAFMIDHLAQANCNSCLTLFRSIGFELQAGCLPETLLAELLKLSDAQARKLAILDCPFCQKIIIANNIPAERIGLFSDILFNYHLAISQVSSKSQRRKYAKALEQAIMIRSLQMKH